MFTLGFHMIIVKYNCRILVASYLQTIKVQLCFLREAKSYMVSPLITVDIIRGWITFFVWPAG